MTRKLFWEDPYGTRFTAKICSIKEDGIILDQTLFYPFSGGQLSDRGFLRIEGKKFEVENVTIDGDDILHHISGLIQNEINIENKVIGELNWEYRYGLMKAHSSQHVFSAVITEKFGINTIKAYLNFEEVSLSLSKNISYNQLKSALEEINEICTVKNLKIEIKIISPEEAEASTHNTRGEIPVKNKIRIVIIENLDSVYCGGTHVNHSNEIGPLFVYEFKKGREIKYYVGNKSLKAYTNLNMDILDSADYLGLPLFKINKKIKEQYKEKLLIQEKNKDLSFNYLNLLSNSPLDKINNISIFVSELEFEHKILKKTYGNFPPDSLLILNLTNNRIKILSNTQRVNANDLLNSFITRYGGQGGGNQALAQGTINKNIKDVISELRSLLN